MSSIGKNLTSSEALQSDAIFAAIKERIAADPAKAKSINGVFAYKITKNGQVVKSWSKFLIVIQLYVFYIKIISIILTPMIFI